MQIESKACLPKQFIYSFDHTEINEVMIIVGILMDQISISQTYNWFDKNYSNLKIK